MNQPDPLSIYAATRDTEAFAAIVGRYQQFLLATCRRKLRDPNDVEDAVQETFLRLAQRANELHTNLGGWLHRCAVNISNDMNRRRSSRSRHEFLAAAPASDDGNPRQSLTELREHLDAALEKIDPDLRELIIQRYFIGRPQIDLAAEMGVSPTTISHRLTRAIELLREQLKTMGCGAAVAGGVATLVAALGAEQASAAVPAALTANIMKIGLTGVTQIATGAGSIVAPSIFASFATRVLAFLIGGAVLGAGSWVVISQLYGPHASLAQSAPPATQPPPPQPIPYAQAAQVQTVADQSASVHILNLHIVDQTNQQSLAAASISVQTWNDADLKQPDNTNSIPKRKFTSDVSGNVKIEIATDTRLIRLEMNKQGWVPKAVQWPILPKQPGAVQPGSSLPDDCTIATERGTTIGGIIQDEQGKPIANVKLEVQNANQFDPGRPYDIWQETKSDALGRWHIDAMPSKLGMLAFQLTRKGYVYKSFQEADHPAPPPVEKLRDKSAVMVMQSPFTLSGTVAGADGQPIVGAQILLGETYLQDRPKTKSDESGKFQLGGLAGGQTFVTVIAPGFAPDLKSVDLQPGIGAVDFKLQPGQTLAGKVIDVAGNPIPDVKIAPGEWRGHRTLEQTIKTDQTGHFEWKNAPDEPLKVMVFKDGFLQILDRDIAVKTGETVITLHAEMHIRGLVTDADTAKSIEAVTVVPGFEAGKGGVPLWIDEGKLRFKDGKYEMVENDERGAHYFRFEAKGYEPVISRPFGDDEVNPTFDVKMHPIGPARDTIQSPDGKPLAGATVVFLTPGYPIKIENAKIDSSNAFTNRNIATATSDAEGHFNIPSDARPAGILILHDTGYARITPPKLAESHVVKIQPWAKIEGTVYVAGKPSAGQKIVFWFAKEDSPDFQMTDLFSAVSDASGKFLLDRLETGDGFLALGVGPPRDSVDGVGAHVDTVPISAVSGQTAHADLGTKGRPITGKIALAPDLTLPKNWLTGGSEFTAMIMSRTDRNRFQELLVNPDGSFLSGYILPGTYYADISVLGETGWAAVGRVQFKIDEILTGRRDDPQDVGTIVLQQWHPQKQPGQ